MERAVPTSPLRHRYRVQGLIGCGRSEDVRGVLVRFDARDNLEVIVNELVAAFDDVDESELLERIVRADLGVIDDRGVVVVEI